MTAPAPTPSEARPLMIGEWADIGICRDGDDYYLAHSSGKWRPAALIWHSRDLRRWRPVGYAVDAHPGDVWLTDLVKDGDRFRAFWLSAGLAPDYGALGGFTTEAANIAGPWSTPGPSGLPPDLVLGRDESGARYALSCPGHLQVQRLEGAGLRPAEAPRRAYDGWPVPDEWATEMSPCVEAPKILRHGGYWHALVAEGGTFGPSTSHMVVAARARDIRGPWEGSPYNPVIRTWSRSEPWWSKGHGQLIEGPGGQWFCILHGIPNGYRSIGRCTLIEPIEWTADGWFRPARHWPAGWEQGAVIDMPLSDDFRGGTLGRQWQFWENHDRARYRVGDGELVLAGRGASPGESQPMAIQPMRFAYEIETEVEIEGNARAGLMLFATPDLWLGLELAPDGVLRRVEKGYRRYGWTTDASVRCRRLRLKIVNVEQDARFYYRLADGGWRLFQPSMEVSFGASLWVNLRPALFCHGEGRARFRRFEFQSVG